MAANYSHDRSRLIYELVVRQEPKQARMCGVGGKADRRPIDPPPIVQLRVVDPALQSGDSASGTSKTRRDSIADSVSSSSPGPKPYDDATDTSNYAQSFLQNPYYFMFASLARPDDETELHWLKDGRTRCTTGSVVSSLYHLKDPHNNNEDAGFFVFPDLSVRTEGSYRLKLSLFEVVGNNVHHCKSIYSAPFYVYTAKKFPGMEESTPLSCSLADQGIKIRIRKDIRVRKRPIPALSQPLPMTVDGEESDGDDDEEDSDLGSGRQQKRRRETKRGRLDDSGDAGGSSMMATNQQQMPWPPAASINPSLGPTIPPPPAAPPNALPSSSVVIPPPPKPGKETPPVNGIAMGVHVPPGSTLPGPSVFDGRGGGILPFEQPAVESATQSPVAAHTTSPPTTQYRDPNLSDEPISPQTMTTPPQMSPPAQQTQQQQYAAPAATTGVAPMPPQQQYQQSAAVTSPAALPPQPIAHAPPTHLPPPSVQHQPQHPQQHMQHPQQATSYAPAPYSQWSAAPMPPAQPSVYDPYYHHPQQHHHYASYAPPPPQQAMPPPPPPPARYEYAMYGHTQPSMGGYGYYDQHQQHHPHPQAQMMQPPPQHPYTQHQMHAPPQFAQPPVTTSAPPSNAPTSTNGTTHAAPEAQQANGINGAGSPGSMPPPSYSASATPVSAAPPTAASAPNGGGYDYGTTPMYNNRPHTEAATARASYAPTSTPAPAPYGMHPTVTHTQPAPPPPHPHQLYSMPAPAPPPPHPSHVAPMRQYAPPPHPHPPPPHPSYSYTPYNAPPPPAPEWNTQPFVNTVTTHQHGWDAYGHHAHQSQPQQSHSGVGPSASQHTQTSPVTGAVNGQGHRIQLAPLIPGASAAENGTHSGTGAPSAHGSNASGSSPTMHSPTRAVHSASSSPTTLRTGGGGGRVSMSSSGRDHRGGGEEGGHGYQNHGHVQGKKNPLSIGSIISEDVR